MKGRSHVLDQADRRVRRLVGFVTTARRDTPVEHFELCSVPGPKALTAYLAFRIREMNADGRLSQICHHCPCVERWRCQVETAVTEIEGRDESIKLDDETGLRQRAMGLCHVTQMDTCSR